MPVPLSILDLATAARDQTPADALEGTVALARKAEEAGYRRVWYAEHHNMARIASSATSVLIAHVAAHTSTIRLGAGGVMLPNHSPLVIAEQYGTLEFGRYTEILMAGYNVAIQALAKWQADGRLPTHARGFPTATKSAERGLRARRNSI